MNNLAPADRDAALVLVNYRKAASVLRAMGNERRLQILCHLLEREHHVHELERLVGISQSALSQHLARLRRDDLVESRRQAQSKLYTLASAEVRDIVSALSRLYGEPQPTPSPMADSRISY